MLDVDGAEVDVVDCAGLCDELEDAGGDVILLVVSVLPLSAVVVVSALSVEVKADGVSVDSGEESSEDVVCPAASVQLVSEVVISVTVLSMSFGGFAAVCLQAVSERIIPNMITHENSLLFICSPAFYINILP